MRYWRSRARQMQPSFSAAQQSCRGGQEHWHWWVVGVPALCAHQLPAQQGFATGRPHHCAHQSPHPFLSSPQHAQHQACPPDPTAAAVLLQHARVRQLQHARSRLLIWRRGTPLPEGSHAGQCREVAAGAQQAAAHTGGQVWALHFGHSQINCLRGRWEGRRLSGELSRRAVLPT